MKRREPCLETFQTPNPRSIWAPVRFLATVLCLFLSHISVGESLLSSELPQAPNLTSTQLETEIGRQIQNVEEFSAISKKAEQMGVRVWVLGGGAANFAFRVRNQLVEKSTDHKFYSAVKGTSFTELFLPGQDIDIVLDGKAEKLKEFSEWLGERFPSEHWDVWALKPTKGIHRTIVGNRDLQRQHTDTWSTVMLELTSGGGSRIRDLRNWRTKPQKFLEGLKKGQIEYLWSENHNQTQRAKEGKNPPILSSIRFLINLFQYGLGTDEASLKRIRRVIGSFKPGSYDKPGEYVNYWIGHHGQNLFLRALDVERAFHFAEESGLREKLLKLPYEEGSPAPKWLSRKPLPSADSPFRVPQKKIRSPRRAKDVPHLKVVTHLTDDIQALYGLTRTLNGHPNFMESLTHDHPVLWVTAGEVGVDGRGDFALRMEVHPEALEGVDWEELPKNHRNSDGTPHYLFLTRDKLILRDTGLPLVDDPVTALEAVFGSETDFEEEFRLVLLRRLELKNHDFTEEEVSRVSKLIEKILRKKSTESEEHSTEVMLGRLLGSQFLLRHPKWHLWVNRLFEKSYEGQDAVMEMYKNPNVLAHAKGPQLFKKHVTKLMASRVPNDAAAWGDQDLLIFPLEAEGTIKSHPKYEELFRHVAKVLYTNTPNKDFAVERLARNVLLKEEALNHPQWDSMMRFLIESDPRSMGDVLLSPELIELDKWESLVRYYLTHPDPDPAFMAFRPNPNKVEEMEAALSKKKSLHPDVRNYAATAMSWFGGDLKRCGFGDLLN